MQEKDIFDHLDDGFFRMLLESLSYEAFVCDSQGTVVYLNPFSEYLICRKRENIVGKNIRELVDDATISASVTLKVIANKTIVTMLQRVGEGRELLSIGMPIFNDDNELIYVLTSSQDVEEAIHLNNDLLHKNQELQREIESLQTYKDDYFSKEGLIFVGDGYENIVRTVMKVAQHDVNVLITGETGTGKEGIAKLVHQMSLRKDQPYIKINCGIIPENLFESELFGYEDGAFTGAAKGGKRGKVKLAHNGTLFFDEIGELPISMQVKLLEFLQEKTVTRVGGITIRAVDTRIVAATNRDLHALCEQGLFRWDLYYRLNVMPIKVPPLRDRQEELSHIAQFILYRHNKKYNLNKRFCKDIVPSLRAYNWPGNIRELEHVLERLYITTEANELRGADLEALLHTTPAENESIHCDGIIPLKQAKRQLERQLVTRAYQRYGSTYKAAKALGVDQSTVSKLLKSYKEVEN